MSPAVSVVIAARNDGRYLGSALGSVQRQTFSDWECLLVDDGSTDNTAEIVRPFLADNRFRLIRCEWVGQARSKNLAFHLTSAPLIAPLDGDDAWMPAKLERQVRLLRAQPNVGVVFTHRFLMDFAGAILPAPRRRFHRGMIFNELIVGDDVCYSSTMIRREILETVGAFDERLELGIEVDLWLRVARHYEFDFIDEALVKHRTGHL